MNTTATRPHIILTILAATTPTVQAQPPNQHANGLSVSKRQQLAARSAATLIHNKADLENYEMVDWRTFDTDDGC
jgi:hypothetical protein